MTIHLVQRTAGYAPCQEALNVGDVVILLGEGVSTVLTGACDCYASHHDLIERGLDSHVNESITRLSDEEIVSLCAHHNPVVTWTSA